ncbi:MAG: hypothetical protein ACI3XR_03585 [Eubacteriales bacterium]
MKKAIMSLVTALLIVSCMGMGLTSFAAVAPGGSAEIQWENTQSISAGLTFPEEGRGHCAVSILGDPGVSSIECTMEIYRQSGTDWIFVDSDTDSTTSSIAFLASMDFVSLEDTYYKAELTITVTKNGVDEVIKRTIYNNS